MLDARSTQRRNEAVIGWERRNRTPTGPPKKRRNGGAGVGNVLAGELTADLHVVNATAFDVLGNDGETYSVVNTYGCCGDDGDECVIFEDKTESPSVWRLLTVVHKAVTLVTNVSVNVAGDKLQRTEQPARVMLCGAATIVDIGDVGECT